MRYPGQMVVNKVSAEESANSVNGGRVVKIQHNGWVGSGLSHGFPSEEVGRCAKSNGGLSWDLEVGGVDGGGMTCWPKPKVMGREGLTRWAANIVCIGFATM